MPTSELSLDAPVDTGSYSTHPPWRRFMSSSEMQAFCSLSVVFNAESGALLPDINTSPDHNLGSCAVRTATGAVSPVTGTRAALSRLGGCTGAAGAKSSAMEGAQAAARSAMMTMDKVTENFVFMVSSFSYRVLIILWSNRSLMVYSVRYLQYTGILTRYGMTQRYKSDTFERGNVDRGIFW